MLFLVRLLWNGQINAFAYWYCTCVLMVNILSKMSFYVHFQYLLNDSLIIIFYWIKVTSCINSKTQLQKELFVIFTYKSIKGILDIAKNLHIPSKSTSLPNPPMFCLYSHTKNKGLRQSILIFWMELLLSSEYLEFLPFHIIHHTQAGVICHQSSSPLLLPTLF